MPGVHGKELADAENDVRPTPSAEVSVRRAPKSFVSRLFPSLPQNMGLLVLLLFPKARFQIVEPCLFYCLLFLFVVSAVNP